MTALNIFLKNNVETTSSEDMFGFDLKRIQTAFGKLDIYYHNLLDGKYEDWILFVNRDFIGRKTHKGMKMKVKDITLPNEHEKKYEIYTHCGFMLAQPRTHGILKGVSAAA